MFDRLIALIGKENFELIQSKKVIVLGCGGVGGYVIEALVRSGIENITIVDKDTVDISNKNRQIIALNSTIGMCKVDAMKLRLEDINEFIKVKTVKKFIKSDSLEELALDSYDYIVDCIDDVQVKVALAKYALNENFKLIISTGTAKKLHPEFLKMTTLDKTAYDPLAKKMRALLKGEKTNRLIVLASDETPKETENNVLGSSAFVPSVGGLLIASYIINDIIK